MKKHVLNISELQEGSQAFKNADITGDGKVAANDILLAKKVVLGILDNLDAYETTEATTTEATTTTSETEATTTVDEDDKLDATFSTETDPETGDENTVAAIDVDDDEELPDDVAVYLDGQLLDPQYYSYNPVTGLVTFNNAAIAKDLGLNADDIKKASIYAAPKAEVTTTASETQATTTASETDATSAAVTTTGSSVAAVTTTGSSAAVTTTGSSAAVTTTAAAPVTTTGSSVAAVTTTGSSVAAVTTTGSSVAAVTTTGASDVAVTTTGASVAAVTTTGASDVAVTTTGSSDAAVTTTGSSVAAVTTTGASDVAVTTTGASDVAVTTTGASDVAVTTTGASDVAAVTTTGSSVAAVTTTGSSVAAVTTTGSSVAAVTTTGASDVAAVTTTGASDVAVTTTGSSDVAVTTTGASDVAVTTTGASDVTTTASEEVTTTPAETTEATVISSYTEEVTSIVKDAKPTYVYRLTLTNAENVDNVRVYYGEEANSKLLTSGKDYDYADGVVTLTSDTKLDTTLVDVYPDSYTELEIPEDEVTRTHDIASVKITDSSGKKLTTDASKFAIYVKKESSDTTEGVVTTVEGSDATGINKSNYEKFNDVEYEYDYDPNTYTATITFAEPITQETYDTLYFVDSVDGTKYYGLNTTSGTANTAFKIEPKSSDTAAIKSVTVSDSLSTAIATDDTNAIYVKDSDHYEAGTLTADDLVVKVNDEVLPAKDASNNVNYTVTSGTGDLTIKFTEAQDGDVKVYANVKDLPTTSLYDASKTTDASKVVANNTLREFTYTYTPVNNTDEDYYVVSSVSLGSTELTLDATGQGNINKYSSNQSALEITGLASSTASADNLTATYTHYQNLYTLGAITAKTGEVGKQDSYIATLTYTFKEGTTNLASASAIASAASATQKKVVLVNIDDHTVVDPTTYTVTSDDSRTVVVNFTTPNISTDYSDNYQLYYVEENLSGKILADGGKIGETRAKSNDVPSITDELILNIGTGYDADNLKIWYTNESAQTVSDSYNYDATTGYLVITNSDAITYKNSLLVKKLEDVDVLLTSEVADKAVDTIELTQDSGATDFSSTAKVGKLTIALKDEEGTWHPLTSSDYSYGLSKDVATIKFTSADAKKYAKLIDKDTDTTYTYTAGAEPKDAKSYIYVAKDITTYYDLGDIETNSAVSVTPVKEDGNLDEERIQVLEVQSETAVDPSNIVVKYQGEELKAFTDYQVGVLSGGTFTPSQSSTTSKTLHIYFYTTKVTDLDELEIYSNTKSYTKVKFSAEDNSYTTVTLNGTLPEKNVITVDDKETTDYETVDDGLKFKGILTADQIKVYEIKEVSVPASSIKTDTDESATVEDTTAEATTSTEVAQLIAKKLALNVLSNLE
jgi:hypothetical protein